ncbi:rcc01693 family protein [uncultured Jannaschia sp.]|uniref:rcc01693 family protein n=1 Tax=uncultured Jannaschia sp. TaxID=293347 RepID=UPI0026371BD7|nr:rcc01693 family protein [uncultured Jannaschia sp.]
MKERFDWHTLMAAGMRGLNLRPTEFWALTPAELAFLLGQRQGTHVLNRDGLEALQRRFPDIKGN